MTPASSNASNDNTNMNQGDELDTFLDAQDLILNENQNDCEMEPSTSSASPSFDCSSYSHSSSSSSSNHASSPQSSTNFNSNSSEMEEEIRTPPLDFMDSINQFDSIGNSTSNQHHLDFDFDFSVPQSPNPKISNSNHQINQSQLKSFDPQFNSNGKGEEQQPDWSDPATLTNLWPSLFNDAINNQAHDSIHQSSNGIGNGNNDQWVFSAQLPISTIDPSTVASSSSSCSDSSSASDNGGAMQVTSNPTSASTSAHNSPPPSIKAQLSESTGPVEKKRKVSSSGAAQSSPQTKSTPATTKKGASTRTNNKRKQSNVTSNPEPKEEKEETPPPVSTRPLPQVDTSVSHSSLFVHPDVSGLSKRDARLVKNRAAAFLSRQRKREEFGELEKKSKALEGACRAIWKSLVKLREEAKGEGKSRVDELIRVYLDQEEKLKQEEDEKMEKDENVNISSKGVREVLNEVVGGLNLDENQVKGKEDEKEKEKKSSNGKGNKRGNKRSRDSTSLEASPAASASSSITIGPSPSPPSNVNEEIQSLRSELNNSKIQNSALLQQLAIERSKVQNLPLSIPSNGFVEPQAQIKLEDLEEEPHGKDLEGMNLDFDYNFSGAFSSKPNQQVEPEFSYPISTPIVPSQNPIPEENLSNSNPNNDQKPISSMKKRSHNLSLAPAFSPSSIGNGPSSPFSLSIPGSPLLHSGSNSSMHGHAHGNGDRSQEDQKTRKTAGGMALMVILFSFALWGMPAGSGRDGGMARLNGQQGSSDGQFDLGRVLNPPSQFNNPSKSKKSTPSSHLSPKDLDLSSEDDSSFSLLIPRNPTSEQRLPSCSITDVSHESARLLPVCRIEGGSSESSNVVTPVLSRSGSEKKKVEYLNSSTQTQDESTKPSSRLALAYHTDSNNYLLDSTLKKSNGRQREGTENESWLTQVLPSNLDINLSDLRSELLDFSGWLSGLGSKSQNEDSSSSTSVYKDFGSNLNDKEKSLVREEFGNYLENRLEMSRERGFILVGPPASSELSRRLGGNSKKSKSKSNDSEDEPMTGDQKTIQADESHQDEEQASCPSIPTKLTLFVPAPKNFKPQECPVSSRYGKSSSSSSSSSGGLSGLGTKALSLRPDTSVTMSRDLGDGLKVNPPKKSEGGKKQEVQFSSSTEAVLRALGLSQCPSLDHQQQSSTSFDSMLDSVGLNSGLNNHGNDGESFLELQFSLSGAKVRNKNQLADAVVGAIQRS